MKAEITVSISDAQFRQILDKLSKHDSRVVIRYLQRRLEKEKETRIVRRVNHRASPGFMEMHIDDFSLSTRTKNQLKKREILKVHDIIEIGFDKLMMLRGIGAGTVKEIRQVVFEQEVDYL